MAFEVGQIVEGKVTGIMNYGAFVNLGNGASGMVHISEIAPTFVNEIKDHLTVGQEVKVKIIAIDERGKIGLSIKQALPRPQGNNNGRGRGAGGQTGTSAGRSRGGRNGAGYSGGGTSAGNPGTYDWNRSRQNTSDSFDDMLSKFMASSDEKISGMKKDNRRSRRGGQNGGNSW
ncbi:MAG: S1 RNA-binding domain-containing protein [Clostridia bacterium]|nr:S1 RNA-binding domain-containing protein [Clostridia bacterium]